jgi:hypothetical protein
MTIGTLNEKSLHAALKEWVARPGDLLEQPVNGYVIDIVRDDLLIEIQTGSFSPLKKKLRKLVIHHPVRLVYPVAAQKWLVKVDGRGNARRRKSPKKGKVTAVFSELVYIPRLMEQDHFTLCVLLTHEEEVRRHDPRRAWRRRGWVTEERRLLEVVAEQHFATPADLAALLPPTLPDPFTTADLALALHQPRRLAQQMTYCLRKMGTIAAQGKMGRSNAYRRV